MSAAAFLFTGQGTQYQGMGSDLLEAYPQARQRLQEADEVLGFSLSSIMLEAPLETLTLTENAQPAILALCMIHFEIACQMGAKPGVLLGHSLGEFAAWVAAGSIALEDALGLVRLRGQAMQEAVPVGVGAMSAIISTPTEEVERLCGEVSSARNEVVRVALYNCPGNSVISGVAGAVEAVGARIEDEGLGVVRSLAVSAPFHCSLLGNAATALQTAMEKIAFKPNQIPVIPNVTGQVAGAGTDPEQIRAWLVEQVTAPVLWEPSLRAVLDLGFERALSLGPGSMVRAHMKRISRRFPVLSLDSEGDRGTLAALLDGGAS